METRVSKLTFKGQEIYDNLVVDVPTKWQNETGKGFFYRASIRNKRIIISEDFYQLWLAKRLNEIGIRIEEAVSTDGISTTQIVSNTVTIIS